jgi:hypothetical protein
LANIDVIAAKKKKRSAGAAPADFRSVMPALKKIYGESVMVLPGYALTANVSE